MLVKFETSSKRVKGLSFHPQRPWILSSLHTGVIQLWDYRMGTLMEEFHEHEGPVRGIDFHPSQPLFASGGDDNKIKIWSLSTKKCLFTLLGHQDYIRSVQFHPTQPWLISASDDQTIKIWNWQSRTCLTTLTGHSYYVMSAVFHPTEDLVISASVDQTVRVWDISSLKNKKPSQGIGETLESITNVDLGIGSNDVMVKYILEGHFRGVNCIDVQPVKNLVASGGDDCDIKIWNLESDRAFEMSTLSSHFKNVSSVKFVGGPNSDLLVSNSEDKTIRVWSLRKGTVISTYKQEGSRFWVLAVHPSQNMIAAGHDNGMIVFKLRREKPAFFATSEGENIFYLKEKYIRKYDTTTCEAGPIVLLKNSSSSNVENGYLYLKNVPKHMYYSGNAASKSGYFILTFTNQILEQQGPSNEGLKYEVYQYTKGTGTIAVDTPKETGNTESIAPCGPKKFATLLKNEITLHSYSSGKTKVFKPQIPGGAAIASIFGAAPGRVILNSGSTLHLFDFEQNEVIQTLNVQGTKTVVWSTDMARVAVLSKHVITLANANLEKLCSIHETIRIKSGHFDDQNVFVYTTLNHMKYLLENGDIGTIFTLPRIIYIAKIKGNSVHFVDRDCVAGVYHVDDVEYSFKRALQEGDTKKIKKLLKGSVIMGESLIDYLQRKGYSKIALQFANDDQTKFDLALECGKIKIALQVAMKLDSKECWERLAIEATARGKFSIVEKACQQTKRFERLSFLYMLTGNLKNLKGMMEIAEMRKDVMSKYHNALYLGNAEERISILRKAGQLPLAYASAKRFKFEELATQIESEMKSNSIPIPDLTDILEDSDFSTLEPPKPVNLDGIVADLSLDGEEDESENESDEEDAKTDDKKGKQSKKAKKMVASGKWGDLDIDIPEEGGDEPEKSEEQPKKPAKSGAKAAKPAGEGWDVDLDLQVDEEEMTQFNQKKKEEEKEERSKTLLQQLTEEVPIASSEYSSKWVDGSDNIVDQIAGGAFNKVMNSLNAKGGIVNFMALKPHFMSILASTHTVLPSVLNSSLIYLEREVREEETGSKTKKRKVHSLPLIPNSYLSLETCAKMKKVALSHMDEGDFETVQEIFRNILHCLIFIPISSKKIEKEIQEYVEISVNYILATIIELEKKKLNPQEQPERIAELASYFANCKLSSDHSLLALTSAMSVCFKMGNYLTASTFAKKIVALPKSKTKNNPKAVQNAKYILQMAEKKPTNKYPQINFDEKTNFEVCGWSLTPIYEQKMSIECCRCPLCSAPYTTNFEGKLCRVCGVAEIGKKVSGSGLFCVPEVTKSRKTKKVASESEEEEEEEEEKEEEERSEEDEEEEEEEEDKKKKSKKGNKKVEKKKEEVVVEKKKEKEVVEEEEDDEVEEEVDVSDDDE